MSDYNRRSRSTLWRQARVDLSRARNCAVLNVDSCTMGEVYENNIECILFLKIRSSLILAVMPQLLVAQN